MAEKPIIIIGAGISGLSAGCYGQMNGYRTQIFEMHNRTGGVCTSIGEYVECGACQGECPNNAILRHWAWG